MDQWLSTIANEHAAIMKMSEDVRYEENEYDMEKANAAVENLHKYIENEKLDLSSLWSELANSIDDGDNLWEKREELDGILRAHTHDKGTLGTLAWHVLSKILATLHNIFLTLEYFGNTAKQNLFLIHFGPFALWIGTIELTGLQIIEILPIVRLYVQRVNAVFL